MEDFKYITVSHLLKKGMMSVRAANCCYGNDLNTLYDILLYYEDNGSFSNRKIKGAGTTTCEELDKLCADFKPKNKIRKSYVKIKDVVGLLNELTKQEREMLLSLASLIQKSEQEISQMSVHYGFNDFDTFAVDFYEKNGYFPMFWIIEQNLKNDNRQKSVILKKTYHIFQNQRVLTPVEVAQDLKLSVERIRQVHVIFKTSHYSYSKIYNRRVRNDRLNASSVFQFLKLRRLYEWTFLGFEMNEYKSLLENFDVISQKNDHIKDIAIREQCTLSFDFILQVLSYVFSDTHTLLGGKNFNEKYGWENLFLIKKVFSDVFDFERMRSDFEYLVCNNEVEYLLDVKTYITHSKCWRNFDADMLDSIVKIIGEILRDEFHLYSEDIKGKILIPAVKKRNPSDVIYEILKEKGNPMHLNDIFFEFKKILPESRYTPKQLRYYIISNKKITYRKRNSIYQLKEWKHIKSGFIRDSIVEFLSDKDLPQSIEMIMEHVLQHYPETNRKSIRASMLSDEKRRFVLFQNGLFGLKGKKYKQIEQVKKRDEKEQKIYDEYEIVRNAYLWNLNYKNFKKFLLKKCRLPSIKGSEKLLNDWFSRVKNDDENLCLNVEQKKKYIEITEIINSNSFS